MDGFDFLTFLVVMGAIIWYVWRITVVSDALADYAELVNERMDLDDALFIAVSRYARMYVLPELTYRDNLMLPDTEETAAAKVLIEALSQRCAHTVSRPDPTNYAYLLETGNQPTSP
jgi:hypothetical protein